MEDIAVTIDHTTKKPLDDFAKEWPSGRTIGNTDIRKRMVR